MNEHRKVFFYIFSSTGIRLFGYNGDYMSFDGKTLFIHIMSFLFETEHNY